MDGRTDGWDLGEYWVTSTVFIRDLRKEGKASTSLEG